MPSPTRVLVRVAASVALLALLLIASTSIDTSRMIAALHTVQIPWLALAICCYCLILPLWAWQWKTLAPASGRNTFGRMLGVVALTSTSLNTTPLLVGEATGAVLLMQQIGLSGTAAFSVMALDQLFVGIAKLSVLGAVSTSVSLPSTMRLGASTLAVAVLLLLAVCLLLAIAPPRAVGRCSARLSRENAARLARLSTALSPVRSVRVASTVLALALAKKAAEVLAILCVQRAFGVYLPVASALLTLALLNLATLLPIVPGNIGVFEAAVVLACEQFGVPREQALGIGVVQHACYFAALALPGYLALLLGFSRRSAAAVL